MDLFEPTCSVFPNDTNAVDMIGHIYRITPLLMASQTHLTFPNKSLKGLSFQREFVRLHWCFILMQVGQWILITSVASVGRGSSPQSWNRNHPMSSRKETLIFVYTLHMIHSQHFHFMYISFICIHYHTLLLFVYSTTFH